MKTSKLTLLTALLIMIGLSAQAQEKYTFGIKASFASTKFILKGLEDAVNFKNSSRNSFIAGATVNYNFNEKVSLQSGLFLAKKGGNFEFSGEPVEEEQPEQLTDSFSNARQSLGLHRGAMLASHIGADKISALPEADQYLVSAKVQASILYLEIPLNFIYTFSTSAGKFHLGTGPYYALGLSGNIKTEITVMAEGHQTDVTDEKVKFGNDEDSDFRRHDFGVNFLAGYQLNNGISIHGGYGLGLSNIAPNSGDESSIKNRLFSVGLGYSFK